MLLCLLNITNAIVGHAELAYIASYLFFVLAKEKEKKKTFQRVQLVQYIGSLICRDIVGFINVFVHVST